MIPLTRDSTPSDSAEAMRPTWPRRLGIGAFLIALWLPVLQMTFPIFTEYEDTENRELAEAPSLAFADLPSLAASTDSYLGDRFGLRTTLIRWNSILRVGILGVSPIPSVVIGKDGWLFYRSEVLADGHSLNDYRGTIPLPETELAGLWDRILDNHRVFSQMGLPYLVVIAPNKHTIYSEYLPDRMRPFRRPTRLEQFAAFLTHQPLAEKLVLDLRQPLFKAKEQHPVYWKTDSHWNSFGAYVGYREIMKRLSVNAPDLSPLPVRGPGNARRLPKGRRPQPDVAHAGFSSRAARHEARDWSEPALHVRQEAAPETRFLRRRPLSFPERPFRDLDQYCPVCSVPVRAN